MSKLNPMFYLAVSCSDAVSWVRRQLIAPGLRVEQTFDFQFTQQSHKECTCPNHGTVRCNCQMVVFLVYWKAGTPLTLVIHGHNEKTWIALTRQPGQIIDPSLEGLIRQLLTPDSIPIFDEELSQESSTTE